jgi:hypothetical protein
VDRRAFLLRCRDLLLLALLPRPAPASADAGQAAASSPLAASTEGGGRFLDAAQLRTLRALCARFVPGPPQDPDPGALQAGAPEYIDGLLGAFALARPPIFAGGPFSHRHGGGPNEFAEFLELDALEELVWRTRIEGSRGIPEREWNGPVEGLQATYARGLASLDGASRRLLGAPFAELSAWKADLLLCLAVGEFSDFLDLAFRHTVEGMYGAPEYGGNRGGVGWVLARWPGDRQPLAYTRAEIAEPDPDQAEAVARQRANARAWLRGAGLPGG